MRETSSGLTCGICKHNFQDGLKWHICDEWRDTIEVDSRYSKGCPVCFSSMVIFPTNKGIKHYLALCRNPKCSSYEIEKDTEDMPFYRIYGGNSHLASFIIRKDRKAGLIWSLPGSKLFHKLINQIAKEFVKDKFTEKRDERSSL